MTTKVGINYREGGRMPLFVFLNEALKQVMKHMHKNLKPGLILLLIEPGNKAKRCCSVVVDAMD